MATRSVASRALLTPGVLLAAVTCTGLGLVLNAEASSSSRSGVSERHHPALLRPADGPDIPLAVTSDDRGDLFLAMRGDTLGMGGISRISPDCREVTRWLTAEVVDVSVDRVTTFLDDGHWGVWVLERTDADMRVVQYSATGNTTADWRVPSTAVRLEVDSYSRTIFVLHAPVGDTGGRLTAHSEDGTELWSAQVPGRPRDLTTRRSSDDHVFAATLLDTGEGALVRYGDDGTTHWQVPLDIEPVAVALFSDVLVFGQDAAPDGPGVVQVVNGDGGVRKVIPTPELVPLDIAAYDSRYTWLLGHRAGDPAGVVLQLVDGSGNLLKECARFPQPLVPTAEPAEVCPAPTPGTVQWQLDRSGAIYGAPGVSDDGTVYFGMMGGLLYAVDCAGNQRWVMDYREEEPVYGPQAFHGSPAIDSDGTIYIGDDIYVPNYFFAVDPDGAVKWVDEFGGVYSQIDTSAAISSEGYVFAGSHGGGMGGSHGCILIYDRAGHRIRPIDEGWDELVGPLTDSPVVLPDGSAVYLAPRYEMYVEPGAWPFRLALPYALVTGRRAVASTARPLQLREPYTVSAKLHHVRGESEPDVEVQLPGIDDPSSPAADGSTVWFAATTDDGPRLLAFDCEGTPRRAFDAPVGAAAQSSPILGRADTATGMLEVLLFDTDGRLVSLDVPRDGEGAALERWTRAFEAESRGAPALGTGGGLGTGGLAYVGAGSSVHALNRITGDTVWTVQLDSSVTSPVTLAPGGMLYVGTESGTLYAIGTESSGLDPEAIWPSFRRNAHNTGSAE